MKHIILTALCLVTFTSQANLCSNIGRAITTDQKSMSNAISLGYLGLSEENVLRAGTSEYVSWKENQKGCLADVVHFAKVTVLEKRGEEVCETSLDLHTKDYFVDRTEYEREYKPRNVESTCFAPTGELKEKINQCEAMAACPKSRDGLLVRDIDNNCECSFFYDRIQFEDVGEEYEGFFNPVMDFGKPVGVRSLF